jgi:hypothetical protein
MSDIANLFGHSDWIKKGIKKMYLFLKYETRQDEFVYLIKVYVYVCIALYIDHQFLNQ